MSKWEFTSFPKRLLGYVQTQNVEPELRETVCFTRQSNLTKSQRVQLSSRLFLFFFFFLLFCNLCYVSCLSLASAAAVLHFCRKPCATKVLIQRRRVGGSLPFTTVNHDNEAPLMMSSYRPSNKIFRVDRTNSEPKTVSLVRLC